LPSLPPFAALVPKLCLGTPDRETLFRAAPFVGPLSPTHFAETEFRGRALPNGVWERGRV